MVRLLADENFNGDVTRGLLLRDPKLDIVRVQDVGLGGSADPDVLGWAAGDGRIVLTHDHATMPSFAFDRIKRRLFMPGMFVINDRRPIREIIEELLVIDACSEVVDWNGLVVYLPL